MDLVLGSEAEISNELSIKFCKTTYQFAIGKIVN